MELKTLSTSLVIVSFFFMLMDNTLLLGIWFMLVAIWVRLWEI